MSRDIFKCPQKRKLKQTLVSQKSELTLHILIYEKIFTETF